MKLEAIGRIAHSEGLIPAQFRCGQERGANGHSEGIFMPLEHGQGAGKPVKETIPLAGLGEFSFEPSYLFVWRFRDRGPAGFGEQLRPEADAQEGDFLPEHLLYELI